LHDVVLALGAEMLVAGGLASDNDEARRKVETALASGAAAEKFAAMVHALGGPGDLLERPDAHLVEAPYLRDVEAQRAGFVVGIETRALGLAILGLGGGRSIAGAAIDPAVGLTQLAGIGDAVGAHHPLCRVHARNEADAEAASRMVQRAYKISEERPGTHSPIIARITAARS
jgi:thymidine phosphorylase